MKRFVAAVLLALALNVIGSAVRAETQPSSVSDDYDESQSNPLRVIAYLLHPAGFTVEWLIFRPLHRLVSQPGTEQFFGHHEHSEDSSVVYR